VTKNKMVNDATRDWTFGGFLRYASGLPIPSPYAQNGLNSLLLRNVGTGSGTFFNRIPGQPLFLKDLNCGCIDPNKQLVLNPRRGPIRLPGNSEDNPSITTIATNAVRRNRSASAGHSASGKAWRSRFAWRLQRLQPYANERSGRE